VTAYLALAAADKAQIVLRVPLALMKVDSSQSIRINIDDNSSLVLDERVSWGQKPVLDSRFRHTTQFSQKFCTSAVPIQPGKS